MVVDGDRLLRSRSLRRYESNEEGIAVAPGTQLQSVLNDAVDDERHLQIDLHLTRGSRPYHPVGDRVVADDAAIGWIHLDVQVVERGVPPGALRSIGSSQGIGVRKDWRGDLRFEHHRRHGQATAKYDYRPRADGGSAVGYARA